MDLRSGFDAFLVILRQGSPRQGAGAYKGPGSKCDLHGLCIEEAVIGDLFLRSGVEVYLEKDWPTSGVQSFGVQVQRVRTHMVGKARICGLTHALSFQSWPCLDCFCDPCSAMEGTCGLLAGPFGCSVCGVCESREYASSCGCPRRIFAERLSPEDEDTALSLFGFCMLRAEMQVQDKLRLDFFWQGSTRPLTAATFPELVPASALISMPSDPRLPHVRGLGKPVQKLHRHFEC